jgi:hypothetical protein
MSREHYGLDEQTSKELRKKIDEIILRDYSYLEHLMQDVAGAMPEQLVVKKN